MTTTANTLRKISAFLAACFLIATASYAGAFTAVVSGNWNSTTTWGGPVPPTELTNDQVTIPAGITVTMNANVTVNGPLSSITVAGTLNANPNTTLTVNSGLLAGTGTIEVDNLAITGTGSFTFAGTVQTGNCTIATPISTSANLEIDGTLKLDGVSFTILAGGDVNLAANTTIEIAGGGIVLSGGMIDLSDTYNVAYVQASATAGLELGGIGLNDVTIDVPPTDEVELSNNLMVKGTLYLNSGKLALKGHNLAITGHLDATGSGELSGNISSNITVNTTGNLTGTLKFNGPGNVVNNITIDINTGSRVAIEGSLTVLGMLDVTNGTFDFNGSSLTLEGTYSGAGTLSAGASSNLSIFTNGFVGSALTFETGGQTLNNFTVNISNGGSVELGSDVTVEGTLNLQAGFVNAGTHTITIGAAGSVSGGGSNSYVITGMGGALKIGIAAGSGAATKFDIGTLQYYTPCLVTLAPGSAGGNVSAGVNAGVKAEGWSGFDISSMQPVVGATWFVESDITANLDMQLEVMWEAAMEVNAFNRGVAYISHYTQGAWDVEASAAATAQAGGMFSLKRSNITSLSPFAVFDENTITAIDRIEPGFSVQLYPNPVTEAIFLVMDLDFYGTLNVEVVALNGQVVYQTMTTGYQTTIPVGSLRNGNYLIRLFDDRINVVKPFTKM